jgi:hypothetical protein
MGLAGQQDRTSGHRGGQRIAAGRQRVPGGRDTAEHTGDGPSDDAIAYRTRQAVARPSTRHRPPMRHPDTNLV